MGDVEDRTLAFFNVTDPKLGRFYLLPKIHKRLYDVPGRPVISNCGYYTENISAFLDYHLQPLAKTVKSYIKDTNDFLKKLKNLPILPENAILCSIDVVGLYPNIFHEFGLNALKKSLDKRENQTPSTSTLMELAELVLKNNYFTHNQKTYKQKRGTAIGTKFAPSYAIISLDDFEEDALANYHQQPWVWWRFIDDIFLIWEHGEESLNVFVDYLNSVHPTLKFTVKYSKTQVEFLDVLVSNENGHIRTNLYVKPTDTHQYLHFSSCHTYHTKSGIPYGQALRLRRIISNDDDFQEKCSDLKQWLLKRGFDERMVTDKIHLAKLKTREELLNFERDPGEPDTHLNLVLRYHPALSSKVHNIVRDYDSILKVDEEHRKVFDEVPRVTYRRAKNLKDGLVRAMLPLIVDNNEAGSIGCGKARCQICPHIKKTNYFTNRDGTKTYTIRKGPHTCDTKYVVYLLECNTCGIQYVGSAKTTFRLRFNNYKSHFRLYERRRIEGTLGTGSPVPQQFLHSHFAQTSHCGIKDLKFTLIDSAFNDTDAKKSEHFWQYKLNVFEPQGLNVRNVPFGGY